MILMCTLNIYKSRVNNGHNQSLTRPPTHPSTHPAGRPPTPHHSSVSDLPLRSKRTTRQRSAGVSQSKESEGFCHVGMSPLLSRLSLALLLICQRKEILKAISILTSLALPGGKAELQTSARACVHCSNSHGQNKGRSHYIHRVKNKHRTLK